MALKFTSLLAMVRKPYFSLVPVFPSNTDLSWIPDATNQNIVTQYAAEAPSGFIVTANVTTYTFAAAPKYIIFNGQLLKSGNDFSGTNTITMPIAPSIGDEFYAII